MEKLRKVCVIVFASLSLFFTLVAIRNKFFPAESVKNVKSSASWNANLETLARKDDKLIFFYVSGNEVISNKIKKLLEKHYVFSVLDKEKNPADFIVFDHFLKRASKSDDDLTCAILTPTLQPIYLSSKCDKKQLEKILFASAKKYSTNRHLLRETAIRSSKTLHFFESEYQMGTPLYQIVSTQMPLSFADWNDKNIPISLITENARVHFNIYKRLTNICSKGNAENAFIGLKKRYNLENNKISKLLIARAQADIAFATDSKNLSELRKAADDIESNKKIPQKMTEFALSLSVLSRAYSVFGDRKYILKARDFSKRARESIFKNRLMPAFISNTSSETPIENTNSLACAYGMSMLANALCDFSEASGEKNALQIAMTIINKLDADYLHNGIWTLNSIYAPSARFARISVVEDSHIPSYIGEAFQAIVRIKKGLNLRTISPAEPYIARLENFFIPAFSEKRASIKLAKFM